LNVDEFDYELPPELIAQRPAELRDRSRLMVLDRETGERDHTTFDRLGSRLDHGDLLVLNDTRVVPARLFGTKSTGGRVELLLTERIASAESGEEDWRCLLRGSVRRGTAIEIGDGFVASVLERCADECVVRLGASSGTVEELIRRRGAMPLPPYIKRERVGPDPLDDEDRERYQTVFARNPGAVAAPTAGLHFTAEGLARLERAGVGHVFLTLHVGPGTFAPVRTTRVEDHSMHEERFVVGPEVADAVRVARRRGSRVVAVGTTVTRALEHCADPEGEVSAARGLSGLFVYPGYRFRVVDAMITNFHLPRSTLLMLVSAFAGRDRVLDAYRSAIRHGYRFYSYGDAMLLRSTR